MTYGDFKDLPRKTALDKILHNKAFNVAETWWISKGSYFDGL